MANDNVKKRAFEDDCFKRQEFAENLLGLIKKQNKGGYESRVIAIKAGFGLGKTFFAKDFERLVREDLEATQNDENSTMAYCHYIDVWKENYTNEPLLALLFALEKIADNYKNWLNKKSFQKDAKKAMAISKTAVEIIPKFGEFITKATNNLKEIREVNKFYQIEKYKEMRDNIIEAFNQNKNEKFVIIVDKIDRCMPEYAIKFLETLKHFFDVEGLYFVLMFNENHLKTSLKNQFDYINFDEWKDKFIDVEFDLSVFYSQENFLRYLVEQKYKFNDRIDKLEMYFTYTIGVNTIGVSNKQREFDTKNIFDNWVSYINKFLNSLENKLNCRQLDILCLRLHLALEKIGDGVIMPDCLISIILVDMFKNMIIEKRLKRKNTNLNAFEFCYANKNNEKDNKAEHILNYFIDYDNTKIDNSPIIGSEFAYNQKSEHNREVVSIKIGNREIFLSNKKAAEFAILANTQSKNTQSNQ